MKARLQDKLGARYTLSELRFCTELLSTLAAGDSAIVEREPIGRWSRPLSE